MSLDPAFLEELRNRLPIATVIGRKTKLVRSGRNWKACCPFHGEKTPSFYVYDDHFHCYGCGVHGDVISFVMQSESRNFREAVESLAAEAGLDVPKATKEEEQAAKKRNTLLDVLAHAEEIYHAHLFKPEGQKALHYLQNRGISAEIIKKFKLGWAPSGQNQLTQALMVPGVDKELLAQTGLFRQDERHLDMRDLFFNRLIFPIRNRRGQTISFGGRTLGDIQPKYLNGPESPVFSKRQILFGLSESIAAASSATSRSSGEGSNVIVVEGYMDVLALHQGGFEKTVAPLGTALTEAQLTQLWRLTPAPLLCFDGDGAGRKAALRAVELALPFLTAEQSLRLCLLPEGEDPDSFIQNYGSEVFAATLRKVEPLTHTLFRLLSQPLTLDSSAEEKAKLKQHLDAMAARIKDKALSSEYRAGWRTLFYEHFRPSFKVRHSSTGGAHFLRKGGGYLKSPNRNIVSSTPLPSEKKIKENRLNQLNALLLAYPVLWKEVEESYCTLVIAPSMHSLQVLRENIVQIFLEHEDTLEPEILLHTLENIMEEESFNALAQSVRAYIKAQCSHEECLARWWHFYGLSNMEALEKEVEEARIAFISDPSAQTQTRLTNRVSALEALRRGGLKED